MRFVLFFLLAGTLRAAGPVIFWTDLDSGPTTGGENNNGVYLTIGGNNFGATQGASVVKINGTQVAQYITWSNTQIGVQVGAVTTGAVTVTVGTVTATGPTWTARAGNIYFIGSGVDNTHPGTCAAMLAANSYAAPWGLQNTSTGSTESAYPSYSSTVTGIRTPVTYYECLSAGDTLVLLNGVNYPYFDGRGWHASLTVIDRVGTAGNPITVVGRPGATATLGGSSGPAQCGIRGAGTTTNYINISGLTAIGGPTIGGVAGLGIGAGGGTNWRVVNNDVQCPLCDQPAAAVDHMGDNSVIYGNQVHNVSTGLGGPSSKTWHAMYFDANNIEVAWNNIYNTQAYNGIQFNDNPGAGLSNISIHDNNIQDLNGSGINFSTIGFTSGTYVIAYNNVIHHVGMNVAAGGSGGDPHSCVAFKGYSTDAAVGTAQVYNNTMYDCGSYLNSANSNATCAIFDLGRQTNITRQYVNNIIYEPSYTNTGHQNVYVCSGGSMTDAQQLTLMAGSSHNIWFSASAPGDTLQAASFGTIVDPKLNNPGAGDFSLASGSPAGGAGIASLAARLDFIGFTRPSAPSIGAYEANDQPCSITTFSLPVAQTGAAYRQTINTMACASPIFSVASGALPSWATLGSSSGVISGTPTGSTPATSSFTVGIADANCATNNSGPCAQTLSIQDITPPTITTRSPITSGTQGIAYGPLQFTATGDNSSTCSGCTWSATGLPSGMTFSGSGSLAGMATVSGTFTIEVTVTNNSGAGVAGPTGFQLTINSPAPGGPGISGAAMLSGNATEH